MRTFKVNSISYTLLVDKNAAVAYINDDRGSLVARLQCKGEWWQVAGAPSLVGEQTPLAAAKVLVDVVQNRTSNNDATHAEALGEEKYRETTKRRIAEKKAAREAAERADADRRASTPLVTVFYHQHDGYDVRVGDPAEVRIHYRDGEDDGSVSIFIKRKSWDSDERVAEVNWSAFGSTSPQQTFEYATAIATAATAAQKFNDQQSQNKEQR